MNQPVVQPLVLPERWDLVSSMAEYIDAFQRATANVVGKKTTAQLVAEAQAKSAKADTLVTQAEASSMKTAAAAGLPVINIPKQSTPPQAPIGYTYQWISLPGEPGSGEYRLTQNAPTAGTTGTTGTTTTGTTPASTATKPTLASDTFKATLALFFGQAEMSKPWVNELYNVTSKYYKTGSTIDESFNLALQDSRNNPALTEFTKRFQGVYALQDKKAAGQAVSVPTIAEYYNAQAKMGDIVRQAGLGSIATEDYLGGLIGKGLSVTDVGNYISGIYNEIQNLPKDIKDSVMTNYPNMDSVSLAKAILTGDKGFVQLQKELTSQELFGAAKRQGLAYDPILNPGGVTMDRATQYASEGLDLASGVTKFGQVAAALPTVSKLSNITANRDLALTQENLESAVIKKTASEIRKMEGLTEEELARYRGNAGTTKASLKGPAGSF